MKSLIEAANPKMILYDSDRLVIWYLAFMSVKKNLNTIVIIHIFSNTMCEVIDSIIKVHF